MDSILQIARRESDSFDEELRQFLLKDFPSPGPKNFIEVLRSINGKIVKDVEARVECAVRGFLNDNDAETFISLPLKLFPLLHNLLEHIDRAEVQDNPYGILSLFTRLIEHFESDFEVVLKSQWQFSYDMCELSGKLKLISEKFFNERFIPAEPFHPPLNSPPSQGGDKGGGEVSKPFHKWFIVLSYPASHRNSAFMHAVQGHEIGQLFNRVSGISSKAIELIDPARVQEFKGLMVQGSLELQYEAMGKLLSVLKNWTEVIVSDIFAMMALGPSYLFALVEFLTTQGTLEGYNCDNPSGAFRIGNLLRVIEDLGFTKNLGDAVKIRINGIETNVRALRKKQKTPIQESLERCLSIEGDGIGREIFNMVKESTKGFAYDPRKLLYEVPELVKLMGNLIPPIELFDVEGRSSKPANIISIMNAGWIVYLTKLTDVYKNFSVETEDEKAQIFDILNRHLLKALEVNEICEKLSRSHAERGNEGHERPGPALEILNYMYKEGSDLSNRLFITPLLKPAQQLGNLSVDLRLGNEFIVPMKTEYPVLDPNRYGRYKVAEVEEYQKKIYKRYGEPFILHPGQFVLGCTLEFIHLPNCFSAYIIGRSSWGRLGLTIATAIAIDPGYSGVLTLELLNSGETPIVLYPGARIAQLILHKQTPSSLEYSRRKLSKYKFPVSVEFSKIRCDADWEDLKEMTK
ncbi:MAG TPA: dCTP deaminase [Candidatus Brocadiia bacterium]|nr:dCTP deaminase [Candidatus Brocadiales bacterium]